MQSKKPLIILLTLCLLLAFTGYALAAGFSDVTGHWAQEQINKWADKGLAGGYQDGTFKPSCLLRVQDFVRTPKCGFSNVY